MRPWRARRAWTGSPILDGVYVWNWYGYGGPATTSYTPRGKPAETEVRALLEAVQLSEGLEEGLLNHVFRVLLVTRHPVSQTEDVAAVVLDQ